MSVSFCVMFYHHFPSAAWRVFIMIFLSGREIDCHLTFPQGFIFSTVIFLLHIKKIYFRFLSVIWIPQCVKDHRVLIIMTRELERAAHVKRCKFCFLIRQQISFVRPGRRSGCCQHLETIDNLSQLSFSDNDTDNCMTQDECPPSNLHWTSAVFFSRVLVKGRKQPEISL